VTLAVFRAAEQRLRGVRSCTQQLPASEEAAVLHLLRVWQADACGSSASAHGTALPSALRQRAFGVPRLCVPPLPAALERAARTAALVSPRCLNDASAYMLAADGRRSGVQACVCACVHSMLR
jgi:hypothetical protein